MGKGKRLKQLRAAQQSNSRSTTTFDRIETETRPGSHSSEQKGRSSIGNQLRKPGRTDVESTEKNGKHNFQLYGVNDEGETVTISTVEYFENGQDPHVHLTFDNYGRDPERILYHYTGPMAFQGIIEHKEIWASEIQYMNDEKEYRYATSLVVRHVRELAKQATSEVIPLLSELEKYFSQSHPPKIYVASFSEEPDQLGQWRAYCAGGGVNLGFSVAKLRAIAERNNFELVKCNYDRDSQNAAVKDFISQVIESYKMHTANGGDPEKVIKSLEQHALQIFATLAGRFKHPSFEEEREWRLVGKGRDDADLRGWRPAGGMLIPYHKINLVLDDSAEDHPFLSVRIAPGPHKQISLFSTESFVQAKGVNVPLSVSQSPYRTLQR